MGTHFENPLLRPFKRVLRKKSKRLAPGEAALALTNMSDFLSTHADLAMHPLQSDRAAAPPKSVVKRVQGSSKAHPDTFIGGGAQTALQYMELLRRSGVDLAKAGSMLDFGIGTGRVSIHFLPFAMERHGCDVNEVAIQWCRERFADLIEVRQTELEPPLPYEDESFDIVLATSVFTHTPYRSYALWIKELHRILRPGGAVAATVHDFQPAETDAPDTGWFETGTGRGLHMNTYLTRSHFETLWGTHFEVSEVEADPPNQTFFVARKAG